MKKKKVGIITFNQVLNYGAILQAYALKEVCSELGFESHIVNYSKGYTNDKPMPIHNFIKASNYQGNISMLIRGILSYIGDMKKWKNFCEFRNTYLSESPECFSSEDIKNLGYDVYIAGSDQIWNYNITGNQFDPVFFGEMDTEAEQIIYASSSQDTPFPFDKELKFKEMLEKMPYAVAIREKKLADYVAKLTGIRYPVVLDPTLLAGRDIFDNLADDLKEEKTYILLYQIDSNSASDISVKSLEKRFGCDVYTMTVPRLGSIHARKGTAGPKEFLSLLKNAKFIVTNSFHGIALSLLFEKQFFVYENGGVMTRIDSLLSELSLLDRKVKLVEDIDIKNMINFKPINKQLEILRVNSKKFLMDSLAGKIKDRVIENEIYKPSVLPMDRRKKEDCCGCTACANICPVSAIEMKCDDEGFYYPHINSSLCIQCGRCDKICGFVPADKRFDSFSMPKAFGVKHLNESVRLGSRSGGAFIAFSDIVLQQGGTVYGAVMQEDFSVCHIRAVNQTQRDEMKKAKYVQSNIEGIYLQVGQDLKKNKTVMFSGTPCQVSGLRTYLKAMKIDDSQLICCDLACYGVPSPKIWKSYIEYIQNLYGKKVIEANFRDKEFGWDSCFETFVLEQNRNKIVRNDYTELFYSNVMLRPSCHNCQFTNLDRPGDLTLADFWGIEKNDRTFNDNKGVSLVLVSTQKGMEIFEQAKSKFEWFECKLEQCIQPSFVKPSSVSPRRVSFWNDYKVMDFKTFLKKYTTPQSVPLKAKK